ncbi:MAG: hypothetical protein QOH26_1496 [Actinomycetota bacterium]|nr:hypothetical protein [Actinomycetota bacterium]
MPLQEHDIRTRDGRILKVRDAGPTNGLPIFVHHGTPMAGLLWEPWVEDAQGRGLRLLSHDRPGYGGSDRRPGRTVADVVPDVTDIADHLGIERYATWGISGGGPHALACAALAPGRCIAAASLAGVGPWDTEGLDFTAGMGKDNVDEFNLSLQGREAIESITRKNANEMLAAAPADIFAGLESIVSDVDKAVMTDDFARFMWECTHVGIGESIEGWLDDDLMFVRSWGFAVSDIDVPTLVVQGREDLMVPYGHGEWLVSHIPGAESWLSEEEGHLTVLVNRVADAHQWLKERF